MIVPFSGKTTVWTIVLVAVYGMAVCVSQISADAPALPDAKGMERLAQSDGMAFLAACLRRYERDVQGYRCLLVKQERLSGKLQRTEQIAVAFREKPFSVLLDWKQNAGQAQRTLFVQGANRDQLLVKPTGFAGKLVGMVERDPEGAEAKQAGRYPITQFGIRKGMERTLAAWQAAERENALHLEFVGQRKIAEVGDRPCFVFRRTRYRQPEDGGVVASTFYFDCETWLQVGSTLKGTDNRLLGEYWFRDVQLNPDLAPETFTSAALR